MASKKVVVISGGSSGIGLEIAHELVGNQVVILSRDAKRTEREAKKLRCDFEICDVTKYNQVEQAVRNVLAKYKRIDILVNNAGVFTEGPLHTADPSLIDSVIDVNTKGTMNLTRAALPAMLKAGKGLIVNIISQGGVEVKADRSIYYTSKWAITGFTTSLREEVSSKGIRVTAIYPGKVATDLFKNAGIKKNLKGALDPKDVARAVAFVANEKEHITFTDIELEYRK